MKECTKLDTTTSQSMILEKLLNLNNDGIAVVDPFLKANFKCPISTAARIETPVRFKQCEHFTCFDLRNFLNLYETRFELKCPICIKKGSFGDIIFDSYFDKQIKTNTSLMEVKVSFKIEWEADDSKQNKLSVNSIKKEKLELSDPNSNTTDIILVDSDSEDDKNVEKSANMRASKTENGLPKRVFARLPTPSHFPAQMNLIKKEAKPPKPSTTQPVQQMQKRYPRRQTNVVTYAESSSPPTESNRKRNLSETSSIVETPPPKIAKSTPSIVSLPQNGREAGQANGQTTKQEAEKANGQATSAQQPATPSAGQSSPWPMQTNYRKPVKVEQSPRIEYPYDPDFENPEPLRGNEERKFRGLLDYHDWKPVDKLLEDYLKAQNNFVGDGPKLDKLLKQVSMKLYSQPGKVSEKALLLCLTRKASGTGIWANKKVACAINFAVTKNSNKDIKSIKKKMQDDILKEHGIKISPESIEKCLEIYEREKSLNDIWERPDIAKIFESYFIKMILPETSSVWLNERLYVSTDELLFDLRNDLDKAVEFEISDSAFDNARHSKAYQEGSKKFPQRMNYEVFIKKLLSESDKK
ncbi:hypothetical protein M3Y97_00966300 [Aphelenchoides bicaudatus]|nr:hypothetical protein M3Y97_00966300 [Aphelenchoides bicaudatus]